MSQTSDPGTNPVAADDREAAESHQQAPRPTEEVEAVKEGDRADARDQTASDQTDDQTADQTSDQTDDQTSEQTDDQTSDQADDQTDDQTDDAEAADDEQSEAERQKSAEEFAAQHDPDKHDVDAGEEFRQPGDWVADEQGPQEWDEEGNLVSGGGPGAEAARQSDAAENGGSETSQTSQTSDQSAPAAGSGRRVSELGEVRDGGYSVGSAATIDDGAMPLGHPVKGWEDTKSYRTPDQPGYDDAEPHLWFTDPDAAERAGFHRAD